MSCAPCQTFFLRFWSNSSGPVAAVSQHPAECGGNDQSFLSDEANLDIQAHVRVVALTDSDGFIWPMPNIFYAVQSHSIPTVSDSYYY